MSTNQLTITAMAVILTAFTQGAAAAPDDKDTPGKARHERQDVDSHKQGQSNQSSNVEIVVRGENEGWRSEGRHSESWPKDDHRDNENSNRQSDPDSMRGLERAKERRSDSADQHARSDGERHWYEFRFGENKDKDQKLTDKKLRWWWPFN